MAAGSPEARVCGRRRRGRVTLPRRTKFAPLGLSFPHSDVGTRAPPGLRRGPRSRGSGRSPRCQPPAAAGGSRGRGSYLLRGRGTWRAGEPEPECASPATARRPRRPRPFLPPRPVPPAPLPAPSLPCPARGRERLAAPRPQPPAAPAPRRRPGKAGRALRRPAAAPRPAPPAASTPNALSALTARLALGSDPPQCLPRPRLDGVWPGPCVLPRLRPRTSCVPPRPACARARPPCPLAAALLGACAVSRAASGERPRGCETRLRGRGGTAQPQTPAPPPPVPRFSDCLDASSRRTQK